MTSPSPAPTIRANVLAGVVKSLREHGVPAERLLRKYMGRVSDLVDPYEQVPLAEFVRFLEAVAEAAGDPALGAKLGARAQPDALGPIGIIFLASPNLKVALTKFSAFYPVWQSGTQVELHLGIELPEHVYRILNPRIWPRRQDAELKLAMACTAIRALVGADWRPVAVHFEHNRGHADTRHTELTLGRIFRAPIIFGQSANRLVIDGDDLERAVAPRGRELLPYMERHLQDLSHAEACCIDSCSSLVSSIIGKRLGRVALDVRSIAKDMGLSARTLQRRLAEEGTSLRQLIQQHRADVVDRLLGDRGTTITSIAHDVGYSDGTTFSRAFKLWRGSSPRQHRLARTRR